MIFEPAIQLDNGGYMLLRCEAVHAPSLNKKAYVKKLKAKLIIEGEE